MPKMLCVSFDIVQPERLTNLVENPGVYLVNNIDNLDAAKQLCADNKCTVQVLFQRDTKSELGVSSHMYVIDYTSVTMVPDITHSQANDGRPPQMVESGFKYPLTSGSHTPDGRLKGGPQVVTYLSDIDQLTEQVDANRNGVNKSSKHGNKKRSKKKGR